MKSILFLVLFFSSLSFAQGAYDFVQVSGEGDVKVKPDYVTLSTTVYSRAMSAQQAQKDNAHEMARIDKILKQDFKIEPKDIQTLSFQVSPQYEYSKDRPVYKGMAVNHTLLVFNRGFAHVRHRRFGRESERARERGRDIMQDYTEVTAELHHHHRVPRAHR